MRLFRIIRQVGLLACCLFYILYFFSSVFFCCSSPPLAPNSNWCFSVFCVVVAVSRSLTWNVNIQHAALRCLRAAPAWRWYDVQSPVWDCRTAQKWIYLFKSAKWKLFVYTLCEWIFLNNLQRESQLVRASLSCALLVWWWKYCRDNLIHQAASSLLHRECQWTLAVCCVGSTLHYSSHRGSSATALKLKVNIFLKHWKKEIYTARCSYDRNNVV